MVVKLQRENRSEGRREGVSRSTSISTHRVALRSHPQGSTVDMRGWTVAVLLQAWMGWCGARLNTPTPALLLATPHETLKQKGTTHQVRNKPKQRQHRNQTRETMGSVQQDRNDAKIKHEGKRGPNSRADRPRNQPDEDRETPKHTSWWKTSCTGTQIHTSTGEATMKPIATN